MESALHEERLKSDPDAQPFALDCQTGGSKKKPKIGKKGRFEEDDVYVEIVKNSQTSLRDQEGRAKARSYLEKCLTEVTYLVSSNPSISLNKPIESAEDSRNALTTERHDNTGQTLPVVRQNNDPSPPEVPLRRQPSPAPPASDTGIDTSAFSNGLSHDEVLNVSTIDPPLDEIALQDHEPIEQIQHRYDSDGKFIEEISADLGGASSTEVTDPTTVIGESWSTADDAWDFEEVPDVPAGKTVPLSDPQAGFVGRAALQGNLGTIECLSMIIIQDEIWIASAGADSTIKVHLYPNEEPIIILRGHTGVVNSLILQHDSSHRVNLYSAGEDKVIRKWSLNVKEATKYSNSIEPSLFFTTYSQPICALAFVADQLISASADGAVRQWNTTSGESTSAWWLPDRFNNVSPTTICACNDTLFVVGYTNGQIRQYDIADTKTNYLITPRQGSSQPNALLYMDHEKGKRLISGHEDMSIHIYDLDTRQDLYSFSGHTGSITSLASLGPQIVSAALHDKSIRVWSITGESVLQENTVDGEEQDKGGIHCIACMTHTETDYLASAGIDGTVKVATRKGR